MGILKNMKTLTIVFAFFAFQQCDKTPQITCSTYDTDYFIGFYNVSEICQTGPNHGVTFGNVVEGNSSALNEIMFLNFNNTGINVVAYIGCTESSSNGGTTIYFRIPDQNLGSSANSVAGEGSYIETGGYVQLSFDVQISEFGQSSYCSYIYSK